MAKTDEDVVKILKAIGVMTDALLGLAEAMKKLIESVGHLREAVEALSAEILEGEDG